MKTNVISFLNGKGGVGKTTTSINVATCLAKQGFRVVVVDTDPRQVLATGMRKINASSIWLKRLLRRKFIPFGSSLQDMTSSSLMVQQRFRQSHLLL